MNRNLQLGGIRRVDYNSIMIQLYSKFEVTGSGRGLTLDSSRILEIVRNEGIRIFYSFCVTHLLIVGIRNIQFVPISQTYKLLIILYSNILTQNCITKKDRKSVV